MDRLTDVKACLSCPFTHCDRAGNVWSQHKSTAKDPRHPVTIHRSQSRWRSRQQMHRNTPTLSPNPSSQPRLWLQPSLCCRRHRLWSTDARKFPALILLTFTVTRHFSAWLSSTHSVTGGPAACAEQTSSGSGAAHCSDPVDQQNNVTSPFLNTFSYDRHWD